MESEVRIYVRKLISMVEKLDSANFKESNSMYSSSDVIIMRDKSNSFRDLDLSGYGWSKIFY